MRRGSDHWIDGALDLAREVSAGEALEGVVGRRGGHRRTNLSTAVTCSAASPRSVWSRHSWSRVSRRASLVASSALRAAASWVSTSLQGAPSVTIRWMPRTWPSTRRSRMTSSLLAWVTLEVGIGRWASSTMRPSCGEGAVVPRSEEHTSELQSLTRISYAVFCLQKKYYVYPHLTV